LKSFYLYRSQCTSVQFIGCEKMQFIKIYANDLLTEVLLQNGTYSLRALNVSDNSNLSHVDLPLTSHLDISNTKVPYSPLLCSLAGRVHLIAQNCGLNATDIARLLDQCQSLAILDLRHNHVRLDPEYLNNILAAIVAPSEKMTVPGQPDSSWMIASQSLVLQDYVPIIYLQDESITCAYEPFLQYLSATVDDEMRLFSEAENVPYLQLVCSCQAHHHRGEDSYCHRNSQPLPKYAIALIVVLPLLIVTIALWYFATQRARLEASEADRRRLDQAWTLKPTHVKLGKRIGKGAYGRVYEAHKDLCVKVLNLATADLHIVHEFKEEIDFLKRATHDNVVKFYGAGMGMVVQGGAPAPFLVLERAEHRSLDVYLHAGNHKDLPWCAKQGLVYDVAKGLAYIHAWNANTIHRDLKAANVLVFDNGDSIIAKVTDFGSIEAKLKQISRRGTMDLLAPATHSFIQPRQRVATRMRGRRQAQLKMASKGAGTLEYMSPEALQSDVCTQATDIFSFGVIMWEVATQRVPSLAEECGLLYWPDRTLETELQRCLLKAYADNHRLPLDKEYPGWYVDMVKQCFALLPGDRLTAEQIVKIMYNRI
jgi:hypothetical protein